MNDNKDRFNFVAITFDDKEKVSKLLLKRKFDFTHIVNSLNSLKNWALKVTLLIYSRRKWNYQRNYWKRTSDRKMKKVSKPCLTERSLLQF
jgi:tRNA(Glu) U13 pseudouridine synthase TruD